MKENNFLISLFLFIFCFIIFSFSYTYGQTPEMDLGDILPLKLFKMLEPGPTRNQVLLKGEKFVAGPDQKWFTADDEIYTYYLYEYDNSGKLIKEYAYKIGKDNVAYTTDDELFHYASFAYDENSRLIRETAHDARGPDGKWFTQDDAECYQYVYFYNQFGEKTQAIGYTARMGQERCIIYEYFFGKIVKDIEYRNKGKDVEWCTLDDKIEKYHKFEYDLGGNLIHTFEYGDTGKDKIWFSGDDVLDAYNTSLFENGEISTKSIKYVGKGLDNKWFSIDDQIQYYILYYYGKLS